MSGTAGESLLDRALADLAEHPNSSAREIARRIGVRDDRAVFAVLNQAAYGGRCQRWKEAGSSPWLWEIPPAPSARRIQCRGCGRSGGELTENGCPACGPDADIS